MTSKINLVCIRHGETYANADNSLYNKIQDHDISLNDLGKQQALNLASYLKNYSNKQLHLLHSPWLRAKQTSEPLIKNLPLISVNEDPIIHEISLSHSLSEMKEKTFMTSEDIEYGAYWAKHGTGESYHDVYKRARIFVQDLKLNKYNYKNDDTVFIISHGVFLIMLKAVLNNYSVEQIMEERWLGNCEFYTQDLSIFI